MKGFWLLAVFLFFGCSVKEYEINQSKIIVIKSSQLRYADLGYIRSTKNALKIELYDMGTLVKSIEINNLICVDDGCMLKSSFNQKYLNEHYPTDILQNVILGKQIYGGENIKMTDNGFVQNIKDDYVDIRYEVKNGGIRFKDRRNGILMKISPSR
ncbi:hypothetical protein [Sulfurimonas sp. HSL-1716]|uniref:hypothetical protein n=1 Tax=Hydrocurvibacter sulfurireducens TaxID=3131937 RepID=UPI0031F97EF4